MTNILTFMKGAKEHIAMRLQTSEFSCMAMILYPT